MCNKVTIIRGKRKEDNKELERLLKNMDSSVEVIVTSDGQNVLERSIELPYSITDNGLCFFGMKGIQELINYCAWEKRAQGARAS